MIGIQIISDCPIDAQWLPILCKDCWGISICSQRAGRFVVVDNLSSDQRAENFSIRDDEVGTWVTKLFPRPPEKPMAAPKI